MSAKAIIKIKFFCEFFFSSSFKISPTNYLLSNKAICCQVASISAYIYPIAGLPESFFIKVQIVMGYLEKSLNQ